MTSLVADTHAFIWYLSRSTALSRVAHRAIQGALSAGAPVYISSVTIVEVIYLVEKKRLTFQNLTDLKSTLHRPDSGFLVQAFDLAIAEQLEMIPREQIPDMPDRMIAATARYLGLPLITADQRIQAADLETIW